MLCKKCQTLLDDSSLYCHRCGWVVDKNPNLVIETVDRGPWKIFAIIGFVLGIVSLAICWVPGGGISCGTMGIVLSALGKKSLTQFNKAGKGLTMSIIATAISFVFTVFFEVIASLM